LQRVLGQRFGVDLSTVAIGRVLKRLGFSHMPQVDGGLLG
jgi:hypothetical protein